MNTLADLTRITGAKRRSVQLWAEAGAILPEGKVHSGSGSHRVFSDGETKIAVILAKIAAVQISIGQLVKYADAIRRYPDRIERGDRLVIQHNCDGSCSVDHLAKVRNLTDIEHAILVRA